MNLKSYVKTIADWPKKGVFYRDLLPILNTPEAFNEVIAQFTSRYKGKNITKIAGIESRGFIFGAVLARELQLPFVPIRKKGKLPGKTISKDYELEYGRDTIEIQEGAVNKGDNILIIDDQLATGGTALAAGQLIEAIHGNVVGFAFVINQEYRGGAVRLKKYDVFSLMTYTKNSS